MAEVNLLKNYPQSKRNLKGRQAKKTEKVRRIARKFGQEYFDGDRKYGYGGYNYHHRFFTHVVKDFINYYKLDKKSRILDVGCGKGFMMHDFAIALPGALIAGIDISDYAIKHALTDMKPFIKKGNAKKLPYQDKSFDLVISINTIHNLPRQDCKKALQEIERVSKNHAFITVDAYRNKKEKERLEAWNLTALTYMSVDDWNKLFKEVGYTGDYWWFIP